VIDDRTYAALVAALKRGTMTRNRMCWEHTPCTTMTVRPIRLDDEARYAIDTILRALTSAGYRVERDRPSQRR
jgi:hypothetical protein